MAHTARFPNQCLLLDAPRDLPASGSAASFRHAPPTPPPVPRRRCCVPVCKLRCPDRTCQIPMRCWMAVSCEAKSAVTETVSSLLKWLSSSESSSSTCRRAEPRPVTREGKQTRVKHVLRVLCAKHVERVCRVHRATRGQRSPACTTCATRETWRAGRGEGGGGSYSPGATNAPCHRFTIISSAASAQTSVSAQCRARG